MIHIELLIGVTSSEEDNILGEEMKGFHCLFHICLSFCFIFKMRMHSCNVHNAKMNLKKYLLFFKFRKAENLIKVQVSQMGQR